METINILTSIVLAISVYLTLLTVFTISGAMVVYAKATKNNNSLYALKSLNLTTIFIGTAFCWALFYSLLCL